MSFGFDPEVPAGYQDADIEMAEMREIANEQYEEERARKRELQHLEEKDEAQRTYYEEK